MSADSDVAGRSRLTPGAVPSFVGNLDRILLAACAAIWLVALGAGVAATVALVDLGRGHQEASDGSSTPWLLYAVIGISAAVIVAAVPLLLRARRSSLKDRRPARASGGPPSVGESQAPGNEAPTEQLRGLGSIAERISARSAATPEVTRSTHDSPVAAVDQLWLRCAVLIVLAMGVAMVAIAVATYLMAIGHDGAAWGLYGLAGAITLGMPAIPWLYLRQLRGVLVSLAG